LIAHGSVQRFDPTLVLAVFLLSSPLANAEKMWGKYSYPYFKIDDSNHAVGRFVHVWHRLQAQSDKHLKIFLTVKLLERWHSFYLNCIAAVLVLVLVLLVG
jgi:hypothetical protein